MSGRIISPDGVTARRRPGRDEPHGPVELSDEDRRKAFKADCPSCKAPIIAMSEIDPRHPATCISKGDNRSMVFLLNS